MQVLNSISNTGSSYALGMIIFSQLMLSWNLAKCQMEIRNNEVFGELCAEVDLLGETDPYGQKLKPRSTFCY